MFAAAVQKRSSMLFHHLYDETTDTNAKNDVIALLQNICTEVSDDIKKDTPILFGELISKMKRLDSDKMFQVYTAVNNGRICASSRGKYAFLYINIRYIIALFIIILSISGVVFPKTFHYESQFVDNIIMVI